MVDMEYFSEDIDKGEFVSANWDMGDWLGNAELVAGFLFSEVFKLESAFQFVANCN